MSRGEGLAQAVKAGARAAGGKGLAVGEALEKIVIAGGKKIRITLSATTDDQVDVEWWFVSERNLHDLKPSQIRSIFTRVGDEVMGMAQRGETATTFNFTPYTGAHRAIYDRLARRMLEPAGFETDYDPELGFQSILSDPEKLKAFRPGERALMLGLTAGSASAAAVLGAEEAEAGGRGEVGAADDEAPLSLGDLIENNHRAARGEVPQAVSDAQADAYDLATWGENPEPPQPVDPAEIEANPDWALFSDPDEDITHELDVMDAQARGARGADFMLEILRQRRVGAEAADGPAGEAPDPGAAANPDPPSPDAAAEAS